MSARFVTIVGILVGGTATILQALVAFGVDLSPDQQTAVGAVAGIVLLIVSALFSPDVPVKTPAPPPPNE
jgi:hypothetical protein